MQIILHDNVDFTKIELKNINPIPTPAASVDEPPSDKESLPGQDPNLTSRELLEDRQIVRLDEGN
jgi:hypothetical protein